MLKCAPLRHSMLALVFSAAALGVLAAGCGNDEKPVRDAHAAYEKAWAAKDVAAIKACVTSRKAKGLDEPAAKMVIDMADKIRPSAVTITAIAFPNEDTAELTLKAQQNGTPSAGTIRMKRENGTWKVDNEDWKMDMTAGAPPGGGPEIVYYPPVSSKIQKVMDELASEDPAVAGKAWLKLAADYNSAEPFLKACAAGFEDDRPIHFDLVFDSFTDNAGHTNRYITTHLKPIADAKEPQAKTVGEALRLPLWAYEDVGNSPFKGDFAAWYPAYAEKKQLTEK